MRRRERALRPPPTATVGQVAETLTVRELCSTIDRTLRQAFPTEVWVAGAISNLKRSSAGHVYFDLVEPGRLGDAGAASIPVALFAARRTLVNRVLTRSGGAVRMTDGTEIRIRGEVGFYERGGRVQLLMSLIDPAYTLGQLAEARQRLLQQLANEDLLEANRRQALAVLPLRVALVTSAGSAAHADFCHELDRGGYRFELQVWDARVQGADAVETLVWALNAAADWRPDVIAIVRGGGARTDLAAFDHEQVVRAVACSPVPVITGIGHETDRSVCDEVAHTAAKTPTACAAFVVERVRQFAERVDSAAGRLHQVASRRLDARERELQHASGRVIRAATASLTRSDAVLVDRAQRIRQAGRVGHRRGEDLLAAHLSRLRTSAGNQLRRAEHPLELAAVRMRAADPVEALRRGWSITRREDGGLLTDPGQVAPGALLVTTLAGGSVTSTVASDGDGRGEPVRDDTAVST